MQRQVDNLELEVQGLRLSQGFEPFPRWMVDLAGRYLSVNSCFEEQFLRPKDVHAKDVIGLRHEEVWGDQSFADKLRLLDDEARRRPDGKAKATVGVGGKQLTVYKVPVRQSGVIVAYAGFITDIE